MLSWVVYVVQDGIFHSSSHPFLDLSALVQVSYSSLIILSSKNHSLVDLLLGLINSGAETFAEDRRNLVLGVSSPLFPVEMLNVPHSSF
jgi:hypothetical protein